MFCFSSFLCSADDRFDATFHTNILIYSNGLCTWIPPGLLKSTCTIDVSYFPFDEQTCDIKFSSWTYDATFLDLQIGLNDTSAFQENGEWELQSKWLKWELQNKLLKW